jgi:hypothetical protein
MAALRNSTMALVITRSASMGFIAGRISAPGLYGLQFQHHDPGSFTWTRRMTLPQMVQRLCCSLFIVFFLSCDVVVTDPTP